MGYLINSFRFLKEVLETIYVYAGSGTNKLAVSTNVQDWDDYNVPFERGGYSAYSEELGVFVVVGFDESVTTGQVFISNDGINYSLVTLPSSTNFLYDVCWSPDLGLFAAVGQSGELITSPNGVNWTKRTSGTSNSLFGIDWSPDLGLFLAGGGTDSNFRTTRSSNGISWTSANDTTRNRARNVYWSKDEEIFLISHNCTTVRQAAISSSTNGTSFTTRLSLNESGNMRGFTYSPSLNLFVAVSNSLANRVYTSPNGITWTARTAASVEGWFAVVWSEKYNLFLAVSLGSSSASVAFMTSSNGINWTSLTAPDNINWSSIILTEGELAPSNIGTFVVISQNGTNRLMTSLDGINWTLRTLPTATYINIAYSDDLDLFVVEDNGGEIITSSDGITWTSRTKPADISSARYNCVKWAKSIGEFISVKTSGTDRLARSSDGINWTSDSFISATFEGLCYSDDLGMLVAYGRAGADGSAAIIYTSTDGTNWTSRTPFRTDSTSVIRKMIWIPELGRFVAGDAAGRFQTSTDGITWSDYGSVTNMGNVYSLAYSADLDVIVALASSSTARAASRAGTAGAWTSRTIGTQTWFQVEYDEYTQVFSAVATDGRATYSTNGTTWATATTPQANTWFGMVIVNGKIII